MSWLSNLFGGGSNNSAQNAAAEQLAQMRRAEEARQDQIRQGQSNIDTAFSQFDPAYYDKFRKTYTDVYNPQIADQYARAKDKLTAVLAGRGTLESTVGGAKFGDLTKTRNEAETDVANRGFDASNELKGKVEGAKTSLYTLNTGAADPALAANQAMGSASSFAAPPTLSPLGQVFGSLAGSLALANRADASSMNPRLPWNVSGSSAPLSGRGSSLFG